MTQQHEDIAERFIDGQVNISSLAVSPDGSQVAFVVSRVDLAENTTRTQVWVAPTDAGSPAASTHRRRTARRQSQVVA